MISGSSIGSQTLQKLNDRSATIGIIGLGYVGLPLAAATGLAGFATIGFDVDPGKPAALMKGESYIDAVKSETLRKLVDTKKFDATTDMSRLRECDVVVICVPTPLTRHRDPDMSYVENTAQTIAQSLRPGQLVVLESTTYPGTTDGVVKTILERTGLVSGRDFFLGFSPEREDPGNVDFATVTIPKVVAGSGEMASKLVEAFYGSVVRKIVPVSSPAVAEAVKITENVFRAVNIALVNELKIVYDAMGIDVWEVIDAAKTKPFGFMPFYPGPGLGGHCIPIDPFYLTWKSREFEVPTRFIELAGEINTSMPHYVVRRLEEALDAKLGKSLGRSRILLIGLAYKKNVSDTRESPSLRLIELIEKRGAVCDYHDPHAPVVHKTREHPELAGRESVALTADNLAGYDAVLISTDHDSVDYAAIQTGAKLIVDTRNAMERRGLSGDTIVKA
jgi:UDP-N-acetyl-D-glucosamine dehydrogenase